eukprot:3276314-Ditylum_brightwellii.AAC.1
MCVDICPGNKNSQKSESTKKKKSLPKKRASRRQQKQKPEDIGPILCGFIDNNPSKRKTLATVTIEESGGQVFMKRHDRDKKYANQYH